MNWKLWTTATLALSMAALWAGCAPPPTDLTVDLSSSGGDGGSGGEGGSGTGGGGATGTGGSAAGAKAFFLSTVYPDFQSRPGPASDPQKTCAGCHATGLNGAPVFLGPNAEASYNSITNYNSGAYLTYPANSVLVINGKIAHTGPAMDPKTLADVETWLNMEMAERGSTTTSSSSGSGGGGPVGLTLTDALEMYGDCMDYTEWMDNGIDLLYNAQTTQGPCGSCHIAGTAGNWLSSNKEETFAMNRKYPFVLRQVTGTVDDVGNFDKLIPSKRWEDKGKADCQPNTSCHPHYTLPQTMIDGINEFVASTIAKVDAGGCGGQGGGGGSGGGGGAGP